MLVNNRISSLVPEVTGWRHWLHQNPELLFDLPKTQEFILNTLAKIGITDVYTGLGKTGVVAIIEGQQSGPMIGLRSDMDALPIFELSDIPHKSSENGKMHACGHDGHTAMLLGGRAIFAGNTEFCRPRCLGLSTSRRRCRRRGCDD
jgi:hippurate hydrolase